MKKFLSLIGAILIYVVCVGMVIFAISVTDGRF